MNFVHPNILYFLLLLIIPIIIHLFNFRRYKKIYFSSLQFIKKVEKETNSTRNLRHYLILATRMLAFAALILAFAQPYFPSDSDGNSYSNIIPIYLDNSFSMSAKGNSGDLLNEAKETIRQIVSTSPKDQRYILVTNSLDGSELRIINRSELSDKLDDIELSPLSREITTPLESINEYLQTINYTEDSHYYVVSDFQNASLKQTKAELNTDAHYSFLKLKPQNTRNLYIDSVWFEQPFQRVNVNNTLHINVQNTGDEKLTNIEINLTVDGVNRQALVDLEAHNNTVVTLNYTDKTTGLKNGKVEVLDENLFFDNRYYFSYTINETIQVLILNDDSSVPYPGMVFETDDFYHVTQTPVDQLKTEELSTANLVVLNGLKSISSGIQTQLNQLVENGVNILVIPAPDFDKASYNNLLASFQLPLFQNKTEQEIRIGKIDTDFNFFTGMFDKKVDHLRMPALKGYISSSVYSNANFNALIQYENGMPLLVEQAQNQNVFAFYTPIAPAFNDFGRSALFASTLLRISEISQGAKPLSLTIGASDEYNVKTAAQKDHSLLLKQDAIEFIPELSYQSGFTSISVRHAIDNQTIKDGVYQIMSDEVEIDNLALNYNRIESDMDYVDESAIINYFKSFGINQLNIEGISTISDIQYLSIKKPNEYWRILLILALTFFLIEMSIIIFWKV